MICDGHTCEPDMWLWYHNISTIPYQNVRTLIYSITPAVYGIRIMLTHAIRIYWHGMIHDATNEHSEYRVKTPEISSNERPLP